MLCLRQVSREISVNPRSFAYFELSFFGISRHCTIFPAFDSSLEYPNKDDGKDWSYYSDEHGLLVSRPYSLYLCLGLY